MDWNDFRNILENLPAAQELKDTLKKLENIDFVQYPRDITMESSDVLGQSHWTYSCKIAEIEGRKGYYKTIINFGNSLIKVEQDKLLYDYRIVQKKSRKDAELIVDNVDYLVKAFNIITEYDMLYNILSGEYEIYSKCATAISREITRRKIEFAGGRHD